MAGKSGAPVTIHEDKLGTLFAAMYADRQAAEEAAASSSDAISSISSSTRVLGLSVLALAKLQTTTATPPALAPPAPTSASASASASMSASASALPPSMADAAEPRELPTEAASVLALLKEAQSMLKRKYAPELAKLQRKSPQGKRAKTVKAKLKSRDPNQMPPKIASEHL
jgi:hypothetical protein